MGNKPTRNITYSSNSKIRQEHNITYYDNGNKQCEVWHQNKKYHRLDGPAFISYLINGDKQCEIWYQNGQLHRLDGYAATNYSNIGIYIKVDKIYYHIDGQSSVYCINNKVLNEQQFKRYMSNYTKQIKTELNLYFNDANLIPIIAGYIIDGANT